MMPTILIVFCLIGSRENQLSLILHRLLNLSLQPHKILWVHLADPLEAMLM